MLKSVGMALLAATVMIFFSSVSFAGTGQMDIQKLWEGSGYAHAGKGMRTMKMMHMMDTDNDGNVTKEEFMAYHEMVWEKMDKNHKGYMMEEDWINIELKKSGG
jgi:Ca2+-binding EF-hand superfamily protein